jgi:plasmid stabilization system protein ParE
MVKTYQVVWDKIAVEDLKDILSYLKKSSEQAPTLVKEAIKKHIQIISTNAFVFEKDKLKTPIDKAYRAFTIYSYRITYKIADDKILILRIRHTSREPFGY